MRESVKKYFDQFQNALDLPGISWWVIDYVGDPDHYYCNDLMKQTFNLDPADCKHSITATCPIAGDYNKFVEQVDSQSAEHIFATCKMLMEGQVEHYTNDFPFFDHLSGKTYYFSSKAKPLEVDDEGRPTILFGIIEDRTMEYEQREMLRQASENDALTGIYNRLKLDEILYHEIARFRRYETSLSLIFIDIDSFKAINDQFGHLVGDRILIELSNCLSQNLRETDYIGRWGGEEFLIICTDTNGHQALEVAEKMRRHIESHEFKRPKKVTASFGISEIVAEDDITTLTKRADQALYKAKEAGRNCSILM